MRKTKLENPVFYHKLDAMNALYKIVLAGMTGYLQPMDICTNGVIKTALRRKFNNWYTGKALRWIESGNDVSAFKMDMSWSIIKPYHARWLVTTKVGQNNTR